MPGIQVDDVHARRAGRVEVDHDVALAVEAARVAHVGVVVGRDVDVVVLGPADALQMNRHRRADRPRRRRDADDAGFDDEEGARERLVAVTQREAVQAAEIVGDRDRRLDATVAADLHAAELLLLRLEPVAADAAADVRLPRELQRRVRRETRRRAASRASRPGPASAIERQRRVRRRAPRSSGTG